MNFEAFGTIAEIAVTLAGVIGIILALQHRDKAFFQVGMITIFGTAFGAMIFALVPDFLSRLLSPDTMWRVACGTFGLYHLFLIINHQVRQRSVRSNTPVQLLITILSFPVVGLKLAVGMGFLLPYAYDIYYLGLLWLVGVTTYLFARLMFDQSE
ncbi:MAG TPA: hypothetical protein VKN35_02930 [Xanthomonadales bacterium]|nr:hypothetical protein [Xanthomonadales bacterium]